MVAPRPVWRENSPPDCFPSAALPQNRSCHEKRRAMRVCVIIRDGSVRVRFLGVLKQQSDHLPAGKLFPVRGKGLSLRAGPGNATRVSPAPARRRRKDRLQPYNGRPASGPAGAKRPPWAGRALAGGFGPRLVLMPAWRCGRGDGPCKDSQGARRRRSFPLFGQAAHVTGTFSASCKLGSPDRPPIQDKRHGCCEGRRQYELRLERHYAARGKVPGIFQSQYGKVRRRGAYPLFQRVARPRIEALS